MDKLKGAQQRPTGVVEAGVLTIWQENGAAGLCQPGERTSSMHVTDPTEDSRQSLDGDRLETGGRARKNRCTLWQESFRLDIRRNFYIVRTLGCSENCIISALGGFKVPTGLCCEQPGLPKVWTCFGLWGGLEGSWTLCQPHLFFGTIENKDMCWKYALILYCEIRNNDPGKHRVTGA